MKDDIGVIVSVDAGVLDIVIDRPDRKGSLRPADLGRMVDALEDASTDDSLRVVLVRSNGSDFCAGADWVSGNTEGAPKPRPGSIQRRTPVQAHRLIALLQEVQLPVVCAVRGWAAGLGCQIALAADFAVAAESSSFWLPFVKRGFTPDSGATWLLPRLIGVARAKELLLLGRPVSGLDAGEWGMIHRSVPDDELDAAVDSLVDELQRAATVAVGLTKREIHRALSGTLGEAMEAESLGLELSSRTGDFREGLRAFQEKRDPDFEGR
jgi:2-(1,2-epoxy-1,2-dihydrophenyl)acetyl-CoA isomerase